ncbi:MAG: hypothetical protein ABFE07_02730 [Armatimonadia bacterium]
MTGLRLCSVLCLWVAASCVADAAEIGFLSNRNSFDQLYVVNADGSGLRRIGTPGRHERCGVWSPDGQRIAALIGERGAERSMLAVMDADGANAQYVRGALTDGTHPAWSPDGKRLAFTRHALQTCNPDGSDLQALVRGETVQSAAWSPDGQWIAYTLHDGRRQRVYLVRPNGTENHVVTDPGDGHRDASPGWTPDGLLTFVSERDEGGWRSYAVKIDGSGLQPLAAIPGHSSGSAFSPDRHLIAFTQNSREIDGGSKLLIANVDGSAAREVAGGMMGPAFPSWSPDGQRLLFSSVRSGFSDVYAVNEDGTGLRQITATTVGEGSITWSPDGRFIATSQTNGSPAAWLYVVGADGRDGHRIDTDGHYQVNPFWLPDGKTLLFANLCCPGFALGLVSLDDRKTLYFAKDAYVTSYAVSPDSNQVAYVAGGGQSPKLHLIALGGTEPKLLSDRLHYTDSVSGFSPNSLQIAFTSTVDKDQDICTIGSDGGDLRRLTEGQDADSAPAWSPDGKTIAFVTGPQSKRNVALMSADGSNPSLLTKLDAASCGQPQWSSDGRRLVFAAGPERNAHIYMLDVGTRECRQLTDGPGNDWGPRWRPQPGR